MREYEFSLTRILPHKDRIYESTIYVCEYPYSRIFYAVAAENISIQDFCWHIYYFCSLKLKIIFFLKLNRKIYNPHKDLFSNHLNILGKILDTQMKIYDNFLIVSDFNSDMTESAMENFCRTYHLHNLIKDRTCFRNLDNLTNFPKSFLNHKL